jgi:16S rRNA (cytosine967-C5)-methyltransferase
LLPRSFSRAQESKKVSAFKTCHQEKPRELALDILAKVDHRGSYADTLLDSALKQTNLEQRDRALLTEMVYGTLRWRGKIDWIAERFLSQPLSRMRPRLRNILRLTLYQVLFLSRIPEYAAVNEGVALAKRWGGQKGGALVNAVVRKILREKESISLPSAEEDALKHLAIIWSHPEWLVRLWQDYMPGEDIAGLLAANNKEAFVTLRVNSMRTNRYGLLERLQARGVTALPSYWSPQGIRVRAASAVEGLPGFREGLFQIQGEASQIVGFLLDPQPHEIVLDACAAPGGKTTHLAELMKDQGEVVALDASARGLEKLSENVQRLGLASVRAFYADVTQGLPPGCAQAYDRILVDAPCTGLGTLRSHPEAKWQRKTTDIKRLAELQRRILQSVVQYLKPGGILVYATCTLTLDENEGVVTEFLQSERKMVLEDAGSVLSEDAKTMTRGKYFLALPHRHDTDGFFAARMRRAA